MRISIAAAALGALLLLAAASPSAQAQQGSGLSVTLGERWSSAATPFTWAPYVITVRDTGPAAFDGQAVLVPDSGFAGGAGGGVFPAYRVPVDVPAGGRRTVQVVALGTPGTYGVELRDGAGHLAASARLAPAQHASATLAVLSDVAQADQQVQGPLAAYTRLGVAVSSFGPETPFPTSALSLAGLDAIVVDRYDSGSLSAAQLQALKDFVGLGGSLILAGGPGWRRTLQPLSPELLPLRPSGTTTASLSPLGQPAGLDAPAGQVASGDVATWGRVDVASREGTPLIVEGALGAGRIVELAFDPLAAPFDSRSDLAGLTWSEIVGRSVSGLQDAATQQSRFNFNGPTQVSPLGGSGPGAWVPSPALLDQALGSVPAAPSPPFGLLAALLVLYVLGVSLGSYAVLRRVGRRGLLWVTVPVLALLCTGAAYGFGTVSRGSDFQLVQIQVQRPGPDGVLETYSLDRVLAPRRGDVHVEGDPQTAVSTALVPYGAPGPAQPPPAVDVGARPELRFVDVPVWDVRAFQTLSIEHRPGAGRGLPVEARLRLQGGRITGTLVNHGGRTVHDLELLSPSGATARLTSTLAPGGQARVDAPVAQSGSSPVFAKGGPGAAGPGPAPVGAGQRATAVLAASLSGQLSLVARTDLAGAPRVEGGSPNRTGTAVLVQPLALDAADAAGALAPTARLVASWSGAATTSTDDYELALPAGLTGHVGVQFTLSPVMSQSQAATHSVAVYDGTSGAWRQLQGPGVMGTSAGGSPLGPGETAGGVVRVRVTEDSPGEIAVTLVNAP